MMWLRQVNGNGAIGFTTGPAEGYSLQGRLGVDNPLIPSPHGAFVNLAHKLGGEIKRIVVKDCAPGDRYLVMYCVVSVERDGRLIEVAVKASDAFAIALETQAPIIVRQQLLQDMPRYAEEGDGGLFVPDSC